ncbi:helix-turn-helix transcriptional regulator [Paenibacillus sp. 22594]
MERLQFDFLRKFFAAKARNDGVIRLRKSLKNPSFRAFFDPLRKESGKAQVELADRLGICYQAVSSLERRGAIPDISKLPLLADSFGVSIDDILSGGRGAELVRKLLRGWLKRHCDRAKYRRRNFVSWHRCCRPSKQTPYSAAPSSRAG